VATKFKLAAVDRNGVAATWEAELDRDPRAGTWTYRVYSPQSQDFYEARFKKVAPDVILPEVLDAHDPIFRGQGLTEAVFSRAVGDSGCDLISSTNNGPKYSKNELRSADAQAVWTRLLAKGRAQYDPKADRFSFIADGMQLKGLAP
jgi:hypothetical protein